MFRTATDAEDPLHARARVHVHAGSANPGVALPGTKVSLDLPLLWLAILLFLVFLVLEPFRTQVREVAEEYALHGWIVFVSLRFAAIAGSVLAFFHALPQDAPARPRTVPLPDRGHDPLLSLRAFACVLVLAGHGMAINFVPPEMSLRLTQGSWAWLFMGSPWAGVWVFFVLSGYLMGKGFYSGRYTLGRSRVTAFYRNRALRILPMYYGALLLVAVLTTPGIFTAPHAWEVFSLLLFSQHSQAPTAVIGALWSVQTEVAFYAVVPLLFLLLQKCPARFPAPLAALALLAAGGFYRYEVFQLVNGMGPLWIEKIYVPLAGNIDLFVLGMAINWMVPWATRVTKGLRTLETGLLLLALFYVLGAWVFTQGSYGPNGPDFLPWAWLAGPTVTAVVTTAVILLMESHVARRQEPTRLARKFVRGTQLAGVLTYAIYVWHEPIFARQGTLYKGGDTVWPSLAAFSVALGLTLLVAYLSYRLIEAPFEQQKVSTPPEALP